MKRNSKLAQPALVSDSRRDTMRKLAAGALASGLGMRAHAQEAAATPLAVERWTVTPGAPLLSPPYGVPSSFEGNVIRRSARAPAMPGSGSSMTPLADLFGSVTPNGLVYERHHAGVPKIDPAQHRVVIHGLVRQPRLFTIDDLLRFPSETRVHFLECSGNTGSEWSGPSGLPVQFTHGLLSCCEWTGVRLSTLLDEVGVDQSAQWILAEGADGAAMTRSLPLARILDRALVVYAQNGERLRPENGYPVRLIVPGFEGNTNIKWLRRIKLVQAPEMTREETSKYTNLLRDGKARQFVFEMDAKSVITRPSAGHRLTTHGYYPISGYAWSGRGRIRRVDISADGGKTWRTARLTGPVQDRALTRFEADWYWNGGAANLQSRAIDETGYIQPTHAALVAARGVNSQYHYNGIQNWRVEETGEVRNA
ncbi:sulfite dehydrogenase [Caballeronia ptereochthonis]|uniref:Cytochrome C biogenesis protein CcmF n=1 Tax=Caballeronia ptereochthonis TaxID=1777144 RepID=A0A158BAD3_9BURK|nr:sulfite dehydrogenase [Caballeronia ptereochthonis]SAK66999.1 cytochrome C biogenesis protein CcmF [Caballeronia ptereochthonis]